VDIPVIVIYKRTMEHLLRQMRGGRKIKVAIRPVLQHLPLVYHPPASPPPQDLRIAGEYGTPATPPSASCRRYSPVVVVRGPGPRGGRAPLDARRRLLLALPALNVNAEAAVSPRTEHKQYRRAAGAVGHEPDPRPSETSEILQVGTFFRAGVLGKLETLSLCECKWVNDHVVASMLAAMRACADLHGSPILLRRVDLSWTGISDEAVVLLAEATSETLISLRARGCALPDGKRSLSNRSLSALGGCKKLSEVKLYDYALIEDHSVSALAAGGCPLRTLSLPACYALTGEGVAGVQAGLAWRTTLTALDVSRNPHITDNFLRTSSLHFACLRAMRVNGCALVTDGGVLHLALHAQHLEAVGMASCPQITDAAVEALVQHAAHRLTRVELGGCDVSDVSISLLLNKCCALKHLDVTACLRVTDRPLLSWTGRSVSHLSPPLPSRTPRYSRCALVWRGLYG
jgi:hypothetical protein